MGHATIISHVHRAGGDVSDSLHLLLVAAHQFVGVEALDAVMSRRLAIIVEEAVANVLDHGDSARDITITLRLDRDHGRVRVTLEDDSTAFDPRHAAPGAMPNPERGGGAGLALIRAWSDIVAYEHVDGINRLVLKLHSRT
jgi:anti-sigma regulatory factor (Ser/Thr protein kinase)